MITVYQTKPGGREKLVGDSSGSYSIAPTMKFDRSGPTADIALSAVNAEGVIVDVNLPGDVLDKINAFVSALRAVQSTPATAPAAGGAA